MKRMHDKKQLSGGVSEEQFEDLVRATPTDCRLVEDQGQLQLQLEHDGNVLGIDTDFGDTMSRTWGRGLYQIIPTMLSADLVGNFSNGSDTYTGYIFLYGFVFVDRKIPQYNEDADDGFLEQFIYLIRGAFDGFVHCTIEEDDGTLVFSGNVKISTDDTDIQITRMDGLGMYTIPFETMTLDACNCVQWNNPNYIEV